MNFSPVHRFRCARVESQSLNSLGNSKIEFLAVRAPGILDHLLIVLIVWLDVLLELFEFLFGDFLKEKRAISISSEIVTRFGALSAI